MLYLVGLGLADEKDITVKGLEIVKKAERVYLEHYTAVLLVEKDVLVSNKMKLNFLKLLKLIDVPG
jgi:diphthine methyl ester synthase